jgi:hypothetical protein
VTNTPVSNSVRSTNNTNRQLQSQLSQEIKERQTPASESPLKNSPHRHMKTMGKQSFTFVTPESPIKREKTEADEGNSEEGEGNNTRFPSQVFSQTHNSQFRSNNPSRMGNNEDHTQGQEKKSIFPPIDLKVTFKLNSYIDIRGFMRGFSPQLKVFTVIEKINLKKMKFSRM